MKAILVILTVIASYVGGYLLLSACGLVFTNLSYIEILRDQGWQLIYFFFPSWGFTIPITYEVYEQCYKNYL